MELLGEMESNGSTGSFTDVKLGEETVLGSELFFEKYLNHSQRLQ